MMEGVRVSWRWGGEGPTTLTATHNLSIQVLQLHFFSMKYFIFLKASGMSLMRLLHLFTDFCKVFFQEK